MNILNRKQTNLGLFDFILNLSHQLSSAQVETIRTLLEKKGFRCQLVDKRKEKKLILFLAYDNIIGILKQAEKQHIYKKKCPKTSSKDGEKSRIKAILKEKSLNTLKPIVKELEQKSLFSFERRKEFISAVIHNEDESFEKYINIFTQSELLNIIWTLLQSIEIDTTDPDIVKLFEIKKTNEDIYITHRLIDFLMRKDLLESVIPLHTPNRQDSLKSTEHIADYYGHNIAIYFKFMLFYIKWLTIPAIFGIIRQIIVFIDPDEASLTFELDTIYCLMIIIWSTLFIKYWRRKSAEISTIWGSSGTHFKASDTRHNFIGKIGINAVTELPEYQYSGSKRFLFYIKSTFAHLPLMGFSFVVMIIFLNMLGYVQPQHWIYIRPLSDLAAKDAIFDFNTSRANIPTILQSLAMAVLSALNKKLSHMTTHWENHRTHTGYNNSIISKRFIFEIINTFTHLLYIAFWRLELRALRVELIALYTSDGLRRLITETLIPFIQKILRTKTAGDKKMNIDHSVDSYVEEKASEMILTEYEVYDDYLEMVIQFGYITLFAAAFPLSGALSLFFNIIETSSDAFKLRYAYRRPFPKMVNGIGSWQSFINFMSHLSLVTNTILIAYNSYLKTTVGDELFPNDECEQYKLLILVFLLEHLIFIATYIIRKKISNEPKWITIYKQRKNKLH